MLKFKKIFLFLFILLIGGLLIMPTGSPDFDQNKSTNPTSPSFDTGEDATRLLMGGGSAARSGRWIFATGFEEGATPFMNIGGSAGGYSGVINTISHQGLYCLKLAPLETIGKYAQFNKTFRYPTSRVGLEFMFNVTASDTLIDFFITTYNPNDLTKFWAGRIQIEKISGQWNMYYSTDSIGGRTLIKSNISPVGSGLFNYFKMVYDLSTNKIVRVYYNSFLFELNVSGYEVATSGVIEPAYTMVAQITNKVNAESQSMLIDNLIVTADEP